MAVGEAGGAERVNADDESTGGGGGGPGVAAASPQDLSGQGDCHGSGRTQVPVPRGLDSRPARHRSPFQG